MIEILSEPADPSKARPEGFMGTRRGQLTVGAVGPGRLVLETIAFLVLLAR